MLWNGAGGWGGDLLARPAAELLAYRLDHLPLARHNFQGLGNVLAEFDQLAATARTTRRCRHDHALARQVSRQRRSHRLFMGEAAHRAGVRLGRPSRDLAVVITNAE
jgi:hypothetical protein